MTSDRKFRLRVLAIASAGALLAAGCATNRSTDDSAGGEASSGAASCDKNEKSPGVTDSEISLGATMPLSGSGAAGGIGVRDGQQAYYKMINKQGGIKGHKIKLTVLDDQYSPAVAQKQMRQLVQQEQVFAISGGEGTPNFLGVVPDLDREGVPAVAPYAPSSDLGNMKAPHVYMSTVDYVKEFEILTQFVLDQDKANPPKNLSLVGVAGNVGDNAKEGMEKALAGKDISVRYFPETPGTSDFTPMATQLKHENADWVFLIITNTDTGQLIQTMKRIGYTPKFITWAGMADDAYIKEFGPISQGLYMALETADLNSKDPKVQEFVQQFTAETGKPPGKFDELGWSQAQLTAEGLRRAKAFTRSCLETALQRISNFETGLISPVTWGPDDREGVDAVGIGQIAGDKLRVVSETRAVTP
jgi:branched-chain amino acid transport system substrate-binding protein